MRKLLVAFLLTAIRLGFAQGNKPLADAGIVTCDYASSSGGLSDWVTSKAGYSVAIELRASIRGSGDHRHCLTSWKLNLRGKDGKEKVFEVAEREDSPDDSEWIEENSFEINGWSSDGQMLLTSQIEAQGDWDETTPIIFDFASNHYWRVELHPLFEKMIPSGCYVVYRAIGFSVNGSVLIGALSTDDDREAGTKPCFAESRWNLDFRHRTVMQVPTAKEK